MKAFPKQLFQPLQIIFPESMNNEIWSGKEKNKELLAKYKKKKQIFLPEQ